MQFAGVQIADRKRGVPIFNHSAGADGRGVCAIFAPNRLHPIYNAPKLGAHKALYAYASPGRARAAQGCRWAKGKMIKTTNNNPVRTLWALFVLHIIIGFIFLGMALYLGHRANTLANQQSKISAKEELLKRRIATETDIEWLRKMALNILNYSGQEFDVLVSTFGKFGSSIYPLSMLPFTTAFLLGYSIKGLRSQNREGP